MANTIKDYTLELQWEGGKVEAGINKIDAKIKKLNGSIAASTQKIKQQTVAQKDSTKEAIKAARFLQKKELILDRTHKQLIKLRIAQVKLNKTSEHFDHNNKIIRKNIAEVLAYRRAIKRTTITTDVELNKQGNDWRKLGNIISATRAKMRANSVSSISTPRAEKSKSGMGGAAAVGMASGIGGMTGGAMASAARLSPHLAAITAVAIGTALAGKAAFRAAKGYQALDASLLAGFGNQEEAAKQMEYINNVADTFAVSALKTGDAWAKIALSAKQSNMPMEDARAIFEGTTIAIRAFNLTADDTQGVMRALGQIMSKGQVTMEDFKGQIAERMPGAMGTLQKSLGVTKERFREMFDQGEIGSEAMVGWANAMRKAAVDSGALAKSLLSMDAAQTRLTTAGERLGQALFSGDLEESIAEFMNLLARFANDMQGFAKVLGTVIGTVIKLVTGLLKLFEWFPRLIGRAVNGLIAMKDEMFDLTDATKDQEANFSRWMSILQRVGFFFNKIRIDAYLAADAFNAFFDATAIKFQELDYVKAVKKSALHWFGTPEEREANQFTKPLEIKSLIKGRDSAKAAGGDKVSITVTGNTFMLPDNITQENARAIFAEFLDEEITGNMGAMIS